MTQKLRTAVALALLVALAIATGRAQKASQAEVQLKAAITKEVVDGDVPAAIKQYQAIVDTYGKTDRGAAAHALVHLAECYQKQGDAQSRAVYERVLRDYADQPEAATEARARLAALAGPSGLGTSEFATRRVWVGSHLATGPSPDGRYVTYTDHGDLAIRDIATGEHRLLTQKPAGETALFGRFSPDGTQIVYTEYVSGGAELRVIGMDGSKPRVLYSNPQIGNILPASWSPDGKAVVVLLVSRDKKQLAVVSTVDGSARILKTSNAQIPMFGEDPCFSPDGRYIAYDATRQATSKSGIFVMTVDGNQENVLVQSPSNERLLGWAPDGKYILFSSDRSGTTDAWLIAVADGKPQGTPLLVKGGIGELSPVGFTSKGSFYFEQGTSHSEVYVADFDPVAGKLLSPPVSTAQSFGGNDLGPAWSPDGQSLAYVSNRGQASQQQDNDPSIIVIRSITSGEERELSHTRDELHLSDGGAGLGWTPDGKGLLVMGSKRGSFGFHRIDAVTGQVRSLLDAGPGVRLDYFVSVPLMSADGKAIFYIRNDFKEKLARILVRDLQTGQDKELHLLTMPSIFYSLALSRDGEKLAFVSRSGDGQEMRIMVMLATGGDAREIQLVKTPEGIGALAWTPDGRQLLFGKTNGVAGDKMVQLWRVPASGGQAESVGLAMEGLDKLQVHPEGRRITFNAAVGGDDVWVMQNFLPKRTP